MKNSIVSHSEPIVLVGGGPVDGDGISAVLQEGYGLVACDGGAGHVLVAGLEGRLQAVIGDMDSLAAADRARLGAAPVHAIAEQDTTDFDKALRSIDAPLVLALGFWGGRADHTLAALSTLLTHADRPCVMVAGGDIVLLAPPRIALDLEQGARVSIWPFLPVAGRSEGLDWPIDGLDLRPDGRLGTSNRATGGRVEISFAAPGALLVLGRERLGPVTAALADAPRWPAVRAR